MATNNDWINDPRAQMTPVCPMQYIYLGKPDQYKAQDGTLGAPKYSTTIILDSKVPEHMEYLKHLNELNDTIGQELLKTITKDRKSYRVKDICKSEEDEAGLETGRYFLKATTNALDKNGNPKALSVVDGNKVPMSKADLCSCFTGTQGRLILSLRKSVDTPRKTVGLGIYLDKAQITEVVHGTGSSLGFDGAAADTSESSGAPASVAF